MKNVLIFFALVILLMPILVFGQTNSPQEPDWQVFAPRGEEFSTEVPVEFSGKNVSSPYRRYAGKISGTYFFIFSEPLSSPQSVKSALEYIRSRQQAGISETYDSIKAEKFAFDDNDGFSHRAFTFKTKSRIYLLHAVSISDSDTLVARFFDRLNIGRINENDPIANQAERPQTPTGPPPVLAQPRQSTGTGTGSGMGGGMGSGTGSGGSSTGISAVPTPAKIDTEGQNSPLQILSKARPAYNDIARVYMISGTVTLRIAFGADGNIGAIMPVTKLPFGLTESAVAAAKSIQFQPAIQNGKPVTTSKMVEYTFSIY